MPSHIQVRIEIEHGSVVKRWLSTAVAPPDQKRMPSIRVAGETFILESEGKTRSKTYSFSASSEASGKILVYDSFDQRSAEEALLFAKKVGAQALFATHQPNAAVTIPTILMSQKYFEFIKSLPSSSSVSVVSLCGSVKDIDVTLKAQHVSTERKAFVWKSKMFVPTSILDETTSNLTFGIMMDATRFIFRDANEKIDAGDDRFSGKVCLFTNLRPGDANRAVRIAMEHGAKALIICGRETPELSDIALPVIANIDRDQLLHLEKAGFMTFSSDLGLSISYGEPGEVTANQKSDQSSIKSAGKVDPPSGSPPRNHQPQGDPPGSQGYVSTFIGHAWKAGSGVVKAGSEAVKKVF
eukprot:CCRYP_018738-RA/>CCRYP_018738-RA protein AED:0.47 eAED:0.47 QI:153/1/0.66/1/0/0/3/0/353